MARARRPCHVGVWAAPAHVLHAIEGAGALYTPLSRLSDMGFRVAGLFRRVT